MTDGVARELEQAKARLAGERFNQAERMALSCHQSNCKGHPDRVRDWGSCDCGAIEVMSDDLASVIDTAIEVGRLRALAEVADVEYHLRTASFALRDPQNRGRNVGLAMRMLEWADALAAREEVQE